MSREHEPKIGQWYENLEDNDTFRVISVDEDAELIEVEYSDGDIEELDVEAWHELDLDLTEEPEGWSDDEDDEDEDDDWDEDEDEEDDDWDEDEDEDDDEDGTYDDRDGN
ncbi:MAG: hypothetical protein IT483_00045 [Gammaproteobacteria bacterium]|nr:hypothetical protein [Gammaproteobacteria bacterium]